MRIDDEHEESFALLRDGRITFTQFARRTATLWRRQAAILMRRWRQPAWVAREDVEQDMLLAVADFTWKWEPDRGTTLGAYVVYNAFDKAKKRAHKARGAKLSGNADSNPSHAERPLSSYAKQGEDADDGSWWERRVRVDYTAEDAVAESEREAAAEAACESAIEAHVVRCLRRGETIESVVARARGPRRAVVEAVVGAAAAVARRLHAA